MILVIFWESYSFVARFDWASRSLTDSSLTVKAPRDRRLIRFDFTWDETDCCVEIIIGSPLSKKFPPAIALSSLINASESWSCSLSFSSKRLTFYTAEFVTLVKSTESLIFLDSRSTLFVVSDSETRSSHSCGECRPVPSKIVTLALAVSSFSDGGVSGSISSLKPWTGQ